MLISEMSGEDCRNMLLGWGLADWRVPTKTVRISCQSILPTSLTTSTALQPWDKRWYGCVRIRWFVSRLMRS